MYIMNIIQLLLSGGSTQGLRYSRNQKTPKLHSSYSCLILFVAGQVDAGQEIQTLGLAAATRKFWV